MFQIAVCDDDERELTRLLELLSEYRQAHGLDVVCKPFRNGIDLLADLRTGMYSLVLLDMLMPGFSGIQTAREIRAVDQNVKLLFLTSSPEFAVESYAVGAFHYLLKPARAEALFPILDRAFAEIIIPTQACLTIKSKSGLSRMPFSRLEYVEVLGKTVCFHLVDGGVLETTGTLATYEAELLARPEFLKVHRSYLLNLAQVETLERAEAVTRKKHRIPVSRSLYTQVKERYLRHLFLAKQQVDAPEQPPSDQPSSAQAEPEQPGGAYRILLVDDEPDALAHWTNILHKKGCIVDCAESGYAAKKLSERERYDCVLLDVKLPGESGFDLCDVLREAASAPVVFLSALCDSDNQLRGYRAGGVDYITKDTPPELFWAKVETRIGISRAGRTQLCFGPLVLDLFLRRVTVEGRELVLTPTEFDLLWLLAEHAEQVYKPDALYQTVWGGERWDDGQTVQVHMSRLRRKLEKAYPSHFFIETVWGEGYRFAPAETECVL